MEELMETKNPLFIIYITLPPSSPATSIRIVWLYIPSWITLLLSIHHALHISMVSHPNAWFLFQIFLPTHIILFHTRGNSLAVTATDTISGSLYLPNIKWLTHVDIRKYVTKTLHGLWDFKACILTHSLWQNINENETGVQATIFIFFLLRNFFRTTCTCTVVLPLIFGPKQANILPMTILRLGSLDVTSCCWHVRTGLVARCNQRTYQSAFLIGMDS